MSYLISTYIPENYFSNQTIQYIKKQVSDYLNHNFDKPIIVDDNSIRRVLLRVLDERREPLDKMYQRVIMYLINEVKTFFLERNTNIRLERFYQTNQTLYDSLSSKGPDMQIIKLSRQPSTMRFWYTFGT